MFFECECDLIGRVCTQMCGINTVDNWILQMNYLNVVTNRIMSLADVFNAPLTLRWKNKKSYKSKCASLHLIFLINNRLNFHDVINYIYVYTYILICGIYPHSNIHVCIERHMFITSICCFSRYIFFIYIYIYENKRFYQRASAH